MSPKHGWRMTVTVSLLTLATASLAAASEETRLLDAFVANKMVLALRLKSPARLEISAVREGVPTDDAAAAKPVFPELTLPEGEIIVEAKGHQWLGRSIILAIVTESADADGGFKYWYAFVTSERSWSLVRLRALSPMKKSRWTIRYVSAAPTKEDDSLEIGFSHSEYLSVPTLIYRNNCVAPLVDVGRFYQVTLAQAKAIDDIPSQGEEETAK